MAPSTNPPPSNGQDDDMPIKFIAHPDEEPKPNDMVGYESSLCVKILMQFAPYMDLAETTQSYAALLAGTSKRLSVAVQYAESLMHRAHSGYQPLRIGFEDPIGEELRNLASLLPAVGDAGLNPDSWLWKEVAKVVVRIESENYQALVTFFDPENAKDISEDVAKAVLEEIQLQWPDAPKLTTKQAQLLHNAIVASGLKIQYKDIKGFLSHIAPVLSADCTVESFTELVNSFKESGRTVYALFEAENTVFSKLGEKNIVQLRYTCKQLRTIATPLVAKLLSDFDLERPGPVTSAALWRKIRKYSPGDTDLSPSARKLIEDILGVFGPFITSDSAIQVLQLFQKLLFSSKDLGEIDPDATITLALDKDENGPLGIRQR
ncbi:hypothetical protein LTR10_015385 [Elasticomyces elasticus]|uniref:Uncharacterized protein n=1 Tax=Exophiala sideris TaxID=1016849 RepID=A0ABR0JJJ1_9EURO|nr:hypothetical protein LTR10_015385 [Elasticomyces elasticus]KAK5030214.1 hypothetical protein LTR13_008232 [Exophiala sideris]KAK5035130.1 hypothetical protein LTS07_002566 [Exophiala sideris]KAK5066053.1 hypothetical protein LTR69_002571 [Exophiala sideris]KAK5178278.1 hypothetical protein LTR44_009153 [Eurotiomycetes sp. CCFEE 6388]